MKDDFALPLAIRLVRPLAGVQFALRKKSHELSDVTLSDGQELLFNLTVRVRMDTGPNFLGEFVEGPPNGRFIYVRCGTLAGQIESCWTRAAKIPLSGITAEQVLAVRAGTAAGLEAAFEATGKDGGPTCATVKLLDGWRLIPSG